MVGLNERLTDHLAQPNPDSPRERQWQVRAKEVVLAAGAIERPLVFPGNDRPGIMLAGAARTYVNRYGAVPGSRAVVITACDEAYRAALDLHEAGVFIAIIADIRSKADGPLADAARHAGLPVQTSTTIVGTTGRLRVDTVKLARIDDHGHVSDDAKIMPCDLVLMSGGLHANGPPVLAVPRQTHLGRKNSVLSPRPTRRTRSLRRRLPRCLLARRRVE